MMGLYTEEFNVKGEQKLFTKNRQVYPRYTYTGLKLTNKEKLKSLGTMMVNSIVVFNDGTEIKRVR